MPSTGRRTLVLIGRISPALAACGYSLRSQVESIVLLDPTQKGAGFFDFLLPMKLLSYNGSWIDELARIAANEELLVTCVSYEIAVQIRKAKLANVRLLYATDEHIQLGLSKSKQNQLAAEYGLALLPTWCVGAPDNNNTNRTNTDISFPIVIRPTSERDAAGIKAIRVDTQQELAELNLSNECIAQPFLAGEKLLIHLARDSAGQFTHRCYQVEGSFGGVTLMMTETNELWTDVVQGCKAALNGIGYVGVCHFEFVLDGPAAYFLDLNLRLGGTTNKVLRDGFDEPALLLHAHMRGLGEASTQIHKRCARPIVNRQVVLQAIWQRINNCLDPIDYPNSSSLTTDLRQYLKALVLGRDEVFTYKMPKYAAYRLSKVLEKVFSAITTKRTLANK